MKKRLQVTDGIRDKKCQFQQKTELAFLHALLLTKGTVIDSTPVYFLSEIF